MGNRSITDAQVWDLLVKLDHEATEIDYSLGLPLTNAKCVAKLIDFVKEWAQNLEGEGIDEPSKED